MGRRGCPGVPDADENADNGQLDERLSESADRCHDAPDGDYGRDNHAAGMAVRKPRNRDAAEGEKDRESNAGDKTDLGV